MLLKTRSAESSASILPNSPYTSRSGIPPGIGNTAVSLGQDFILQTNIENSSIVIPIIQLSRYYWLSTT